MKKTAFLILLSLVLSLWAWNLSGFACTNFLITKGASADGSTMITYAADSHVLYGELYFTPAGYHPEGAMLDVYDWDSGKYLGQIKQVRQTFSVVGNMNEQLLYPRQGRVRMTEQHMLMSSRQLHLTQGRNAQNYSDNS